MTTTFKYSKQVINTDLLFNITPEQIIMLDIEQSMKNVKKRSFAAYLKSHGIKSIKRTTLSFKEIAFLLNISTRLAEDLCFEWVNNKAIKGNVVYTAGLNCYYLPDVYEIFN